MSLSPADFPKFFAAVYGRAPFPWQERLALRVCESGWPQAIALPTAAGKTGCIDIGVFSLACRGQAYPRRIFFVVDRRIVVDQAFLHARKLSEALRDAKAGVLHEVADALCALGGEKENPLEAYALRGGIYRETAWARSPIQPMVITSTVDQVGSRLLFRGYGVSESMMPVHAGLVGNDSLILLDEAHCSNPFNQTVRAVERFRTWTDESAPPTVFQFVSITATPADDVPAYQIERDQEDDRAHPVLGARLSAEKPATLVVAEKAQKSKWRTELVKELAKQARELMGQSLGQNNAGVEHRVNAIGIVVNRVATARELAAALRQPQNKGSTDLPRVELLTGRMRPVDRDQVLSRLAGLFSGKEGTREQVFVVATQCIEVGADLDFDALVTECASLDALRQRFGRLNRVAARPGAKAVIVVRGDQAADSEDDPIYGRSLRETWKWMQDKSRAGTIDFGVASIRQLLDGTDDAARLRVAASDAPVMFPAHLDCWVQTHPIPTPDPDPAPFLHGSEKSLPDVQVVFRSDLGEKPDRWAEIVALCPPSSAESLPVRIDVFKKWLADQGGPDDSGDVEGEASADAAEEVSGTSDRISLRWRGPNTEEKQPSHLISDPRQVRPGDVFVVRHNADGIQSLGDFLTQTPQDQAELAFTLSRGKPLLRLVGLELNDEDPEFAEKLSAAVREKLATEFPKWPPSIAKALTTTKGPARRIEAAHPLGGYVVSGRRRLPVNDILMLIPHYVEQAGETYLEDSEANESPKSQRAVSLDEHSLGVVHFARRFAAGCGLDENTYATCGLYHDIGKLDPRNQAMLKSLAPRLSIKDPLAKSGTFGSGNRAVHRYPVGARHELLSVALLTSRWNDDLLLHLIATHHGVARPLVGHVEENEAIAEPFTAELLGESFSIASCKQCPAEWNPVLAERFWRIVRRYGWWGSAYRETVFRLADHAQSRAEQKSEAVRHPLPGFTPPAPSEGIAESVALPLPGLEGTNPLAFLAALGVLRVLTNVTHGNRPPWVQSEPRLSWGSPTHPASAVLHLDSFVASTEVLEYLSAQLMQDVTQHPCCDAMSFMMAAEKYDRAKLMVLAGARDRQNQAEWATALFCESALGATSQLMVVRRDYVQGNFESVMKRTKPEHLRRSLFEIWDYADALDNQSLHWEPSEDRRHAYQWHQASGDPTRKKSGGMLGANRLALEAWPLFMSFPAGEDRVSTRGFSGNRANDTRWSWPLWSRPMNLDAVRTLLGLPELQEASVNYDALKSLGIYQVNRCRRILVGKTPNLTPAYAV